MVNPVDRVLMNIDPDYTQCRICKRLFSIKIASQLWIKSALTSSLNKKDSCYICRWLRHTNRSVKQYLSKTGITISQIESLYGYVYVITMKTVEDRSSTSGIQCYKNYIIFKERKLDAK